MVDLKAGHKFILCGFARKKKIETMEPNFVASIKPDK